MYQVRPQTKGDIRNLKTTRDKTETVKTRLSKELKEEFEECLRLNDEKQSEILRKCVRNYIRNTKRN